MWDLRENGCYNRRMMDVQTPRKFTKDDVLVILGFGVLWCSFQISPYYPVSLFPSFGSINLEEVVALHTTYALCLIAVFLFFMVVGRYFPKFFEKAPLFAVIAGVLGAAGSLCIVFAPDVLGSPAARFFTLAVIAIYVGTLFVLWLRRVCRPPAKRAVFLIGASFVFFSCIWFVLAICGSSALNIAVALCPLVSAVCFALFHESDDAQGQTQAKGKAAGSIATSTKVLPWGVIVLCIVFIYFGVVSVRLFTAAGMGISNFGMLDVGPQLVTVFIGLCIVAAITASLVRNGSALSAYIYAIVGIALLYMVGLLVITLGDPSGVVVLTAKRILVASEHGVEVLLLMIMVAETIRLRLSAPLTFSLFGVVVLVGPQLFTLDFMFTVGAMEALRESSIIAPIAAVGAFAIAVIAIGLLLYYSRRTANQINQNNENWEEELCRRATAAYDLTPRELDTVVYTYRGYSARKIAETLYVSESTAKAHLAHSYRKMGIHSKQELIDLIDRYRQN